VETLSPKVHLIEEGPSLLYCSSKVPLVPSGSTSILVPVSLITVASQFGGLVGVATWAVGGVTPYDRGLAMAACGRCAQLHACGYTSKILKPPAY